MENTRTKDTSFSSSIFFASYSSNIGLYYFYDHCHKEITVRSFFLFFFKFNIKELFLLLAVRSGLIKYVFIIYLKNTSIVLYLSGSNCLIHFHEKENFYFTLLSTKLRMRFSIDKRKEKLFCLCYS